ncbi:ABC transporter ATP-binding protein [Dactylosporangium sp. CA-139066]|uniref:ABC transporter ATP-binding protein n=1 Tax=Dactylosporangium sp. CA-139066 TaxID=3239930 RepID=UPI003D92DCA8
MRMMLARAGGLLVRSSPGAFTATLLAALLQGIAPNAITLAAARLVGAAAGLADEASARASAASALGLLAVALVIERIAAAVAPVSTAYLGYRFITALDRVRMTACLALPGLAHFESPTQADRLEAADWSKTEPPVLLERLVALVRRGTMLIGSMFILAGLGWWAPLVVSAAAVGVGINDWRHAGRRSELQRDAAQQLRYAGYHRTLAVNPTQAREMRLFAVGDWLAERQQRLWAEGMAPIFRDLRRQLRENVAINAVRAAAMLVPLLVALMGLRHGSIGAEQFTAVVLALRTAANGMHTLEGLPGGLRQAVGFLPEVFAIQDLPRADPRLDTGGRIVPGPVVRDGIRFEDVAFRYPGESGLVLDGLTLHLPAGESLALVGVNGAGKSTIVKLMCRFYDPTHGRITLDGTDIRDLDLAELRRRIAVVFQEPMRLPMPAIDNLAIAGADPDRPDPGLLAAAAAQVGAGEFINRLPHGWDTTLSREFGGVDLSGGQWHRLALARMLAAQQSRTPPLLILDEPTAALDVHIETDLHERFEELRRGATTLLISHRFSTVRMASRVAVLDRGRIIESGSHEQLMAAEGRYAELFTLQAQRFTQAPGTAR